jgi:hypothetical protein
MNLRMELAYVAMAALAVMIFDVTSGRAAMMTRCNAQPERCRYSPDGRNYFYSSDRRMPQSTATTSTRAAWGCGATDGHSTGRSWGFANRAAASYRALAECTQRSTHGPCHVVSCNPSVTTYGDAQVAWFSDKH